MNPEKHQIIDHRNRLRDSAKLLIVPFSDRNSIKQNTHSPAINNGNKISDLDLKPEVTNRKRKVSQDLSVFRNRHKTREIVLSTNFSDLFQTIEKLGEGAQSTVKKCRQKNTGNIYAVKIFISDTELIDNLKVQYKILRTVTHESIIRAHYLFVNPKQNTSHMVLQYSEFPTLRQILSCQLILTQDETSSIISKVLIAIKHLHSKGICHRDIKPDNILYNQNNGEIKIIDFEIAKTCKNKFVRTEMWTKTGTIQYCAPEMFQTAYTELVDIWAVGILTFEMITGRHPFKIQYVKDAIKVLQDEIQFPESMSNFAKDFIRRCLTKNPLTRPSAKQALTSPFILVFGGNNSTPSVSQKLNLSFDEQSTVSFPSSLKCFQDEFKEEFVGDDIGIRCFTDEVLD